MQIELLCVSKPLRGWIKEACDDYEKRLRGQLNYRVKQIAPAANPAASSKRSDKAHRAKEAERLIEATAGGHFKIALDEKGKQLTTREFSELIDSWRHTAVDTTFYIGGADGLDENLLNSVDRCISLSKMTLPHQFARLLFTEQLYRALSILSNHPYHRE